MNSAFCAPTLCIYLLGHINHPAEHCGELFLHIRARSLTGKTVTHWLFSLWGAQQSALHTVGIQDEERWEGVGAHGVWSTSRSSDSRSSVLSIVHTLHLCGDRHGYSMAPASPGFEDRPIGYQQK